MAEQTIEEVLVCTSIASSCVIYSDSLNARKRKLKRKYWVKDYFRERDQLGGYKLTLEELRLNNPFSFSRYLRMNTHVLRYLFFFLSFNDFPFYRSE